MLFLYYLKTRSTITFTAVNHSLGSRPSNHACASSAGGTSTFCQPPGRPNPRPAHRGPPPGDRTRARRPLPRDGLDGGHGVLRHAYASSFWYLLSTYMITYLHGNRWEASSVPCPGPRGPEPGPRRRRTAPDRNDRPLVDHHGGRLARRSVCWSGCWVGTPSLVRTSDETRAGTRPPGVVSTWRAQACRHGCSRALIARRWSIAR